MEVRTELDRHLSISAMEADGELVEQIQTAEASLNGEAFNIFLSWDGA